MACGFVLTLLACSIALTYGETEAEIYALGYQLIPGYGYYKVHSTRATWEDAQNTCLDEGGYLVIYNSKEELDGVGKLMKATLGDSVDCYIGFHSLYKDNTAVFVTGVPLNESAIEYYINENNNDRVGSSFAGGLYFWNPRDRVQPFVCERELWSTYEVHSGYGYYKLHTEGKTWIEAYQTCKNEGAHLAVVNSVKEAELLKSILNRFPAIPDTEDDHFVSLGFHMMYDTRKIPDTQRQYNTIFGGSIKIAGYSKWAAKQPLPGAENHCGAINRNGELLMARCNMKLAYFCEKDI